MILHVSGRVDIVRYYSEWLLNRFQEGRVATRNPLFPTNVSEYELTPKKLDAVVFSSKDYSPFLEGAREISAAYRTLFHYTITGYGADLEPESPPVERSAETLCALSEIVGKERVVWRYTPVLLTDKYTIERHLETFAFLMNRLKGHISHCIIGFVEMHAKLPAAIPDLVPLTVRGKEQLAEGFGRIAAMYGVPVQSCGTRADYSRFGVAKVACVTLGALGEANGCTFRDVKHLGNRRGCGCITMRDPGFYDSCPARCKYCYANLSPELIRANMQLHDPKSPLLIGNIGKGDIVYEGVQESLLRTASGQLSIFDL